jgi:putative two-component system response regulator
MKSRRFAAVMRSRRRLLIAAVLFGAIFALRVADERPGDAIFVLCVVPVVLVAIDRGPRGGLAATLIGLALTAVWALAEDAEVGPLGYAARTLAFGVVGVVVGRYADQARQREHRLERSQDVAVELLCTVGADGYFTSLNATWSQVLGYSRRELLSRPFLEFVHPADRERTQRVATLVADGNTQPVHFENRYRARDGSYRRLAWKSRHVAADGLLYASARDVTAEHDRQEALEREVAERTRDVQAAREEVLRRLALAAEYRDDDTHQHTQRVGDLAAMLAARMGESDELVEQIRLAAPLHDVGKLGLPDAILLKRGRLTAEERRIMQTHTTHGAAILAGSAYPVLTLGEQIALTHHERWDGTGYPSSLSENAIPLAGRIVAVADVFDALTHSRPYKQGWPVETAVAEIVSSSGTHFDPRVVEAFQQLHFVGAIDPSVAGGSSITAG